MRKIVLLWCMRTVSLILLLISVATFAGAAQPEDEEPEKLVIEEYKGRVVYLDFWASWCVPCNKSFPWLSKMQKKYKSQGLEVITINLDKERALAEKFLKDFPGILLKVIYDPEGQYARKYKLTGMPGSFIFDRDGNLSDSHVGFRSEESDIYEEKIKKLL